MKSFLIKFASMLLIRNLVKVTDSLFTKLLGVISIFKLRAMIPSAHISSSCRYSTLIKYGENITIGKNTRIGPKCVLGAKGGITVGDNVVISREVQIETAGLDLSQGPPFHYHKANAIHIADNVWIGASCIILGGVTIGENAIIGAGTVVAKSVPANAIMVGASIRNVAITH